MSIVLTFYIHSLIAPISLFIAVLEIMVNIIELAEAIT